MDKDFPLLILSAILIVWGILVWWYWPKPLPATKDKPFTNSLGMRFVPVPVTGKGGTIIKTIYFSIWPVRVRDYAEYVRTCDKEVNGDWKNPKFEGEAVCPSEDCPVVSVNWNEAKAFCDWLSKKENNGLTYRLPTDHEWSCAVGIGHLEDPSTQPKDKSQQIKDVYPWGNQWPPPKGAGNFADMTAQLKLKDWPIIDGYDDGFATTSPVGSFQANKLGLYDLSGNVWEWCDSNWDENGKILRGGSWGNFTPGRLLSSSRYCFEPGYRNLSVGFRVVVGEDFVP